jgi:hypothetical protein
MLAVRGLRQLVIAGTLVRELVLEALAEGVDLGSQPWQLLSPVARAVRRKSGARGILLRVGRVMHRYVT